MSDLSSRLALEPLAPGAWPLARAAVAVIVRPAGRDLEALFVERARRQGDRWSGDVAFPGGVARASERDEDAARREAREEVGLELQRPLGRLGDRYAPHPARAWPMRVRAILFEAPGPEPRIDGREVVSAFWAPLSLVLRPALTLRRVGRLVLPVPAVQLGPRTLWGMTLSMARELARRAR